MDHLLDYFNVVAIFTLAGAVGMILLAIKPHVALQFGDDNTIVFRTLCVVFGAALAFFTVSLALDSARECGRERALASIRERFSASGYLSPAADSKSGQLRTVQGKVLPVDVGAKAVDAIFLSLPEELRPESPGDVETIAWIRRFDEATGLTRSRSGAVTRNAWRVTLINRKDWRLLGEQVVYDEASVVQFIMEARVIEPLYRFNG